MLTNVNLEDEEKAERNRKNKSKTAGLGGVLQDEDEDVLMGLRNKRILEKYDAEIDGPKMNTFTLEANGAYVSDRERAFNCLQEELRGFRVGLKYHRHLQIYFPLF